MADSLARPLALGAAALVVGFLVGANRPSGKIAGLEAKVAELEARECRDRPSAGGGLVAEVFRPPPPSPQPPREPRPQDPEPQEPLVVEPPPEVVSTTSRPGPDLEGVREVLDARRAQAMQALLEQSGATEEQMVEIEAIADQMNDELLALGDEAVTLVEERGGPPTRRDMMSFAADALDVFIAAEDAMGTVLTPEQLEGLGETEFDPTAFVDGRLAEPVQFLSGEIR